MSSIPTTGDDERGGGDETRRRLEGHLALAAVQVFFGLFPVLGLAAMTPEEGFSPWALAVWRIVTGSAALGLLALGLHRKRALVSGPDLARLAVLALLGITLNQGLFLTGLARSTAINAGLLICLIPVFTFLVAALFRLEAFSWRRGSGVVIALLSALPLFLSRGADLAAEHATGNLLMAGNALCYAIYLVFSRPLTTKYPPLVVIAWVYVLSLPWLPLFAAQAPLGPAVPSPAVWGAFAYVVIFPTVLAYLLNMIALSRLPASTTAFYVFAQPFITALAAWWILGEELEMELVPAAAGLFLGMALVLRRERPGSAPGARSRPESLDPRGT